MNHNAQGGRGTPRDAERHTVHRLTGRSRTLLMVLEQPHLCLQEMCLQNSHAVFGDLINSVSCVYDVPRQVHHQHRACCVELEIWIVSLQQLALLMLEQRLLALSRFCIELWHLA